MHAVVILKWCKSDSDGKIQSFEIKSISSCLLIKMSYSRLVVIHEQQQRRHVQVHQLTAFIYQVHITSCQLRKIWLLEAVIEPAELKTLDSIWVCS